MKKLLGLVIGLILLVALTGAVRAAETTGSATAAATTEPAAVTKTTASEAFLSEIQALGGSEAAIKANFALSNRFSLFGIYNYGLYHNESLNAFIIGLCYRNSDNFSIGAGARYDFNTQAALGFSQVDFLMPFGDNLKLAGHLDHNYYGNEWTRYEVALKIEVFNNMFIYSGIRGDTGAGAPVYDYRLDPDPLSPPPTEQEPYLFLKTDFNWKVGKFNFGVQPYLYIRGVWFHNYSIKYNINNQIALVFNTNTLFDLTPRYLVGVQWKF